MGSYALSQSSTNYTNTPLTLGSNEKGVALAGNRDTLLGGSGNVAGSSNVGNMTNSGNLSLAAGSTYNALDGGAIQGAFDYGKSLLQITGDVFGKVLDARSYNADVGSTIAQTPTDRIQSSAPSKRQASENTPNYTALAVALAAAFFAWKALK